MSDKLKRVISAAIMIPIVLVLVITGGLVFKIGLTIIMAIALHEYISAFKNNTSKAIDFILFLGYLLNIYVIFGDKRDLIMPVTFLIVLMSMAVPIFSRKYNIFSSAITIMGYIYVVDFFTMLVLIRGHENGNWLIWLVFIIAWFCDTSAYYFGRFLGKRKLCPEVSPKKTIAGSLGGVLGSIVGVIIWGYFVKNVSISWYQLILLGALGSIAAQLGDLTASLLKRNVGIKDFGKIMPGHGGILDRFDSILFVIPIVYYYIVLFLG